jgi:hypothetical protein
MVLRAAEMSTKEIHSENPKQKIVARVSQDWLDGKNDEYLAVVIESDHPRYKEGEKLDWHRFWFALNDGYGVEIKPAI